MRFKNHVNTSGYTHSACVNREQIYGHLPHSFGLVVRSFVFVRWFYYQNTSGNLLLFHSTYVLFCFILHCAIPLYYPLCYPLYYDIITPHDNLSRSTVLFHHIDNCEHPDTTSRVSDRALASL